MNLKLTMKSFSRFGEVKLKFKTKCLKFQREKRFVSKNISEQRELKVGQDASQKLMRNCVAVTSSKLSTNHSAGRSRHAGNPGRETVRK